jgi:Arc/MetJ family transcription regulator
VGDLTFLTHEGQGEKEAMMVRTHTTLDLDRDLLRDAAEALGTTRTTDTVHAALRDVVARRRRAWLARRDFSELEAALPDLRTSRIAPVERPDELGGS